MAQLTKKIHVFILTLLWIGCCCTCSVAEGIENQHYCPICKIEFSYIGSPEQTGQALKSIDGRPLDQKPSPLPGCPLCGGVYKNNSYPESMVPVLERAVWSAEYQQVRQRSSHYRYARLLELTGADAKALSQAWLQVAWAENPEQPEYESALAKSAEYFEQFFVLEDRSTVQNLSLRLKFADILRQLGKFEKALKQLQIAQAQSDPDYGVLMRIEKQLIMAENKEIHALPDGNRLHEAVLKNDDDLCSKLVTDKELIVERNLSGLTPLQLAIKLKKTRLVEILVQSRLALDLKSRQGQTALHIAVENNHEKLIALLVEAGASLSAKDSSGQTPLAVAAKNGNWPVFSYLIDFSYIQTRDSGLNTLLHLACAGSEPDRIQIVKKLLELNADVNARNFAAFTPLHVAAMSSGAEIIELLVRNGAKIDSRLTTGETPLFICRNDLIKPLIELGADLNLTNNEGRTPLTDALLNCNAPRVAAFKASGKFGIQPETFVVSGTEVTAWGAAASGNLAQLKKLIEIEPSQINLREVEFGETPLHRAVLAEQAAAVRFLLDSGSDPSAGNYLNRTPLHYAAAKGNLKLVKMLVEAGSDVFVLDARGSTPLHEAAAAKHRDVYEFLRLQGASDSTRNNAGFSAKQLLDD